MAAYYYKLPADQGNAYRYLGRFMFEEGNGVSIDLSMDPHDMKLAADQEDARGQLNYGRCLAKGDEISIDLTMAAYYFKLAADQGHRDGQYCYAQCLEKGKGVEIDIELAMQYYTL